MFMPSFVLRKPSADFVVELLGTLQCTKKSGEMKKNLLYMNYIFIFMDIEKHDVNNLVIQWLLFVDAFSILVKKEILWWVLYGFLLNSLLSRAWKGCCWFWNTIFYYNPWNYGFTVPFERLIVRRRRIFNFFVKFKGPRPIFPRKNLWKFHQKIN